MHTMQSCEILPYPATRRVGYIRNMARLLASYRPETAERTIATQLTVQRQAMLRRGLPNDIVEREVTKLEHAVRTALCNILTSDGDVA